MEYCSVGTPRTAACHRRIMPLQCPVGQSRKAAPLWQGHKRSRNPPQTWRLCMSGFRTSNRLTQVPGASFDEIGSAHSLSYSFYLYVQCCPKFGNYFRELFGGRLSDRSQAELANSVFQSAAQPYSPRRAYSFTATSSQLISGKYGSARELAGRQTIATGV